MRPRIRWFLDWRRAEASWGWRRLGLDRSARGLVVWIITGRVNVLQIPREEVDGLRTFEDNDIQKWLTSIHFNYEKDCFTEEWGFRFVSILSTAFNNFSPFFFLSDSVAVIASCLTHRSSLQIASLVSSYTPATKRADFCHYPSSSPRQCLRARSPSPRLPLKKLNIFADLSPPSEDLMMSRNSSNSILPDPSLSTSLIKSFTS